MILSPIRTTVFRQDAHSSLKLDLIHNPDLPSDPSPDYPSVEIGLVPVLAWLPWVTPARVLP